MQSAANEFKGLEEKCFIHAKCCPQQLQHYKYVSGTFHQGDDKYSAESRGNQCACIGWNTLCFSTSKSASTWQRDDIDSLLNAGDKMYRDLGFIGYPYVEDLPKEVAFRDKHYKISILKTYTGGLCSADSSDGIFYVLRDSLDLCFTARRHAMMVCKDNAIAMFRDNFGYYILDSHARSSQGLIDPNGTAVLLMFKTLNDLHKGILRLFNSISSVHCETAYSLTELEICIDGEQWNIGHSSLVQLYLEKQAKMKEQKIKKDKKGQKEKSEKNLTAAAMRKRKSRQNSNYRTKEQEYNTAKRKEMREDPAIRAAEQECDTLRRKRKRKNPAIAATEKEYNTAKRKIMREDPAIRAAEQECDTLRRKTKKENPAIKAKEQEYNTAKRKEMREDPAIRAAEQESDTLRRKIKRENPAIAATEKQYNTAKRKEMREDPAIRAAEQECDTLRRKTKREDPAIAATEKEYNTAKRKEMREDPAIRAAEQECDTLRRKTKREDPAIAATEKEYNTAKRKQMREDPAIRAAEQECDSLRRKTKREDPAIAATEKEYNTAKRKEMREDPAIRAAEQECDTLRRKTKREDPAIAATEKEYNTAKRKEMREDPAIRAAEQECDTAKRKEKRKDPGIRTAEQECDTSRRKRKRSDPAIKAIEQEYNTSRKKNVCRTLRFSKSTAGRLQDFRSSIENGCIFVCVSCNRRCFDTNIVQYSEQFIASIEEDYPDLLEKCVQSISESNSVQGKQYICHTCKNYLKRGKMPPMSTRNGLDIVDLKDSNGNKLQMSELEATLIAKNILFMKIFNLPKSRWSAVKDKTVNAPIQDDAVLQTVSSFPRMPSEAGIIPVKLKRKATYKQHHIQQYIRPNVLREALTALKIAGNPHYQFVTTHENYEETCKTLDPEGYELMKDSCIFQMLESPMAENQDDQLHAEQDEKDSGDDDELEYNENDAVRKWQYTQDDNVLMDNMFPENQINVHADDSPEIANIENEGVSVAPGEGQMPTNILTEKDWDVKTFPHLFPNGKYGLHYNREQRLTNLQYFNQRLLNKDIRYSSSPCFVYAASTYIEKQQLERNINISYTRGTTRSTDQGNTVFNLEDSFAVLDKISNTPKYWQQAKNELIAKLENLGPFQFFFTLSCAEKRWLENMAVILKNSLGDKLISYKYRKQSEGDGEDSDNREDSDESQPEVELLIDGIPMDEYFEQNNIQINIHDEMRKNVLTLTRHFDHRVKMFMKNIVMGDNNPMNVQYFNYRIEFQARGAGHTHGVLWLDLEAVERDLEGNKIYHISNNGISVPKLIFPGVKEAMTKIKNDERLTDEDIENLVKFVDTFVTVDLDDPDVKGIVNEVNTHHHTKACRKKGTTCRFNYPRLPSTETVIAKPYIHMDVVDKKGQQASDEEKRRIFQKLNAKLEKIKEKLEDDDLMKVLECLSPEEQILELCKKCKVTVEDYTKALKYSYGRYSITYKRNLQERYVNCYNKEWIKAWNGNMDIQVCLDYFAVITYVTDYVSKDDNTLTQVLLEAAKHCKSETARNRMKTIKDTFLTHRQMGEAEVYYRIFPELHLKDSNVKTVFLPTGFPENRTHFMQKVSSENMHQYTEDELVAIDGKDCKYVAKPSVIDKYMRRPGGLEHMCLMQFVKMYDSVSSVPKKVKWKDGCSIGQATETEDIEHHINRHKDFHKILILPENKCDMSVEEYSNLLLPKYISLLDPKPGEPRYLRLRSFPLVVRLHKFNVTKERHEYLYSELLQYRAFRCESQLSRNDEKQCAELYCESANGEEITKVVKLKNILMEHQESVQEGKSKAEAILSDAVGEQLDPELEQELQDGELEGMSEHPEYQVLIPPDSIERSSSTRDSYYCPIQLSPIDELYKQTHKLDKEQMLVLEEGIQFAKSVVKFTSGSTAYPKPPRIIVQGGAGSGKSTVISTLVQWMEKIFRKEGDNPDHPYILVCAPTGTAAAVVHGQTLHHSFSFNFGNEYMSLSDKARDLKRALLQNLKVVIIDEISMVKSDLLYQLDLRLREVMERPSEVFGGIAIFCFGDLLQLKPVKAPYVFEQPKCKNYAVTHALEPLWHTFRPINLVQNHRQGNDKTYADILNRIRTGNVTDADCNQLEERVRDINHQDIPSDAMYVTCTNARVKEINDAKLDNLQTEQAVLQALNINATCKEFSPPIGIAGNVHTSPFMNKLILKVKARVMLVFNCDTNDGLTNGAMGEVLGFQRNKKGEVIYVIVHFYNASVGHEKRKRFPELQEQYPNYRPTPVSRIEFSYSLSKKSYSASSQAKVIQYPLRLAFAATAHKFQGQTVQKPMCLVVDLMTVREPAQAYVMLSRVQEIDQVFIVEKLPADKLKPSIVALKEVNRLKEIPSNCSFLQQWYSADKDRTRIAFLNTRSLQKHFKDLQCSWTLCSCDILCISETWFKQEQLESEYILKGYEHPHLVSVGPGKGLATYAKTSFQPVADVCRSNYQISKFASDNCEVISVYRSESAPYEDVLCDIAQICNDEKLTILGGDFNVCVLKNENNLLIKGLTQLGFIQMIFEATHIAGGAIDHCYVRQAVGYTGSQLTGKNTYLHSVYWSDHDAILISMPWF